MPVNSMLFKVIDKIQKDHPKSFQTKYQQFSTFKVCLFSKSTNLLFCSSIWKDQILYKDFMYGKKEYSSGEKLN